MKKLLAFSLVTTNLFFVSNQAKSEIIIPAGTILETLDTHENTNYYHFDVEQIFYQSNPLRRQYLFNEDVSCNLADNFFTPETVFGHAFTQKCLDLAGTFTDDNTSNISTNTSNISTNTSNIKNLGEGVAGSTALTAALTALPQTSKDSKLSCGIGSGAYSSRYAVGFGCASKVNERVDINAGGSYVFGGSKSYGEGTLDSGVLKAGIVFKLGEIKKTTQISMKEGKELKEEIIALKENNQNIISQNKALLARLEKLEKIALSENNSKDLAIYKLK